MKVKVIGAGLAGSEAAWQLAQRGIEVELYEMRPHKKSPAHHTAYFAELVCSNSLRGDRLENAVGLLKEELRRCGSLIMECAEATRVEAGGCLAVDRVGFSALVTQKVKNHPLITVIEEEVTEIPEGPVIIASGPLTSDALSDAIGKYFGETGYLHFFDAAAPLVTAESIDRSVHAKNSVCANCCFVCCFHFNFFTFNRYYTTCYAKTFACRVANGYCCFANSIVICNCCSLCMRIKIL